MEVRHGEAAHNVVLELLLATQQLERVRCLDGRPAAEQVVHLGHFLLLAPVDA